MHPDHPFARAQSLVLRPTGAGRGYSVTVSDRAETPLGVCDGDGVLRDHAGQPVLQAPLHWDGRRDRATSAAIAVADAHGTPLGAVRIANYGIGPRARKATLAILDAQGGEVARLEPSDARGEQLAMSAAGVPVATIGVTAVKAGFLRKDRVYALDFTAAPPAAVRPLLLAAAIRYDALLNAVVTASRRD
jgi:hypothetical protein